MQIQSYENECLPVYAYGCANMCQSFIGQLMIFARLSNAKTERIAKIVAELEMLIADGEMKRMGRDAIVLPKLKTIERESGALS